MSDNDLALLHEKVDRLTVLLEAQNRRQQALEELQQDMIPIVNHAIKLTIDELAEVGSDFQLEDLLVMLKRMLRNTRLIMRMMDQLEAVSALGDEIDILGKQVFASTVSTLDRLERGGYFALARGSWHIVEQIAAEFGEEDVRALGDNIVTILKTVRSMTQPEVMALVNNMATAIREEPQVPENISMLALARELGDPKVRQGLARLMLMLKAFADSPERPGTN